MSTSSVYIAGVGFSPLQSGSSSARNTNTSAVSAATKALLDAGVTYDDVSHGVGSVGSEPFKAFDEGGITVDKAESGSELESAFRQVKDKGAQCVLVVAGEKSAVIGIVLVSDKFLWKRPYLKDSSAVIQKSDSSKSEGQGKDGLQNVCQIVWDLRGWTDSKAGKKARRHYQGKSKQSFELSRVGQADVPKWKDIEYRQDGKHRLRYNPASDTKEISQEDLEAVRAIGKKHQSQVKFKKLGGDRAALAKL